jgi:sporulation protein YlmC with PRC-barrel domain
MPAAAYKPEMIDIPAYAKVECADGPCGESSTIILNPTTREVSHFVVQDKSFPDRDQRLVPVDQVVETSRSLIRLRCTRAELAGMDHFFDSHYTATQKEPAIDWSVDYTTRSVPRATLTGRRYAEETVEHIPPGELAVGRGTRVEATDGHVGHVAELVVDPSSGHISHLVLEKGHLWGKKEVTLPVSAIDFGGEDAVYLKLDRKAIEQLPAVPVRRHHGTPGDEPE